MTRWTFKLYNRCAGIHTQDRLCEEQPDRTDCEPVAQMKNFVELPEKRFWFWTRVKVMCNAGHVKNLVILLFLEFPCPAVIKALRTVFTLKDTHSLYLLYPFFWTTEVLVEQDFDPVGGGRCYASIAKDNFISRTAFVQRECGLEEDP